MEEYRLSIASARDAKRLADRLLPADEDWSERARYSIHRDLDLLCQRAQRAYEHGPKQANLEQRRLVQVRDPVTL